jgi:hypothetical protein
VLRWADDSPRMFRQLRIGRAQLMVGIELRCAGFRWRVTKPALSIASWKMGLLLLTLAVLIRIAEALDTLVSLPMTIYGFLLDSATGQGVQGARARVVGAGRTLVARCLPPSASSAPSTSGRERRGHSITVLLSIKRGFEES